ncbi:MAG TPA: Fe-S cluster assembly protein SufD [Candidatus Dormibacteraeota bacterium]|nr:Fe-S cluster assembly protein SufD [Candidatus Dormibacteraeota bacterium]
MAATVESVAGITATAVEARAAGDPAWLAERRRAAWEAFASLPMPDHMRDEDWRRTDIAKLDLDAFSVEPPTTVVQGEALLEAMRSLRAEAAPDSAFLAVTRRGLRACDDMDMLTAQGVIVSTLEEAAHNHPELVQRALAAVRVGESKFLALWDALWRTGVFVYVPRSVDARVPVWAAYSVAGDNGAIFPATLAVLDDNASLTLVDAYASPAGPAPLLCSAAALMVLGDGARLDYHHVQQWGAGAWHFATHRAVLGRNARLRVFGATLGSRLQKVYWDALLDGNGSEALLTGVCFGDETQHLDLQSLQRHRGESTHSDLVHKVAVRDKAVSVYSGLIDVEKQAQHADGYVQNRNLMLGEGAKASGIPRLEIKANDVRCSHGVTAGHIDDEQRFYLESRGVPREEADRLIVRGFMQDALDRTPHAGVRDLVARLLDAEIHGRSQAGLEAAEDGAL